MSNASSSPTKQEVHPSFSGSSSKKSASMNGTASKTASPSLSGSGSKSTSTRRPPRTPKGTIRKARSSPGNSAATRSKSTPTRSLTPTETRDGHMFHVRVTLGYLKSISVTEKKSKQQQGLVTAYAALDSDSISSEHDFCRSVPLTATSDLHTVLWPKQSMDGSPYKNKRRLYFSTVLQKDEADLDLRETLTVDDDASQQDAVQLSFSPQLVNIQLGVARDDDVLPLGVATLVVNGSDVSGKHMELPVRTVVPTKKAPQKKGIKRLFTKSTSSFSKDDYKFSPNSVLRIRLDVTSEPTSLSGPVLWGDCADDDNDSFGSITVLDLNTASDREEASILDAADPGCESIEVVSKPSGTTIISGLSRNDFKLGDESASSRDTSFPIKAVIAELQESCKVQPDGVAQPAAILCGLGTEVATLQDDCKSLDFDDSSTIATSQYKGTRAELWKKAAAQSPPRASARTPLNTVHEQSAETSPRAKKAHTKDDDSSSSGSSSSDDDEDKTIGEETVNSLAAAKQVLQRYAKRTGVDVEELLENSENYDSESSDGEQSSIDEESIVEAKNLLQRYASRIGVDVEDLLKNGVVAEDESLVSFNSPTSTAESDATSECDDASQGSKSSKSRFSLFLR